MMEPGNRVDKWVILMNSDLTKEEWYLVRLAVSHYVHCDDTGFSDTMVKLMDKLRRQM